MPITIPDATYIIQNLWAKTVLEPQGDVGTDGTLVVGNALGTSPFQLWIVTYLWEQDAYTIKNASTNAYATNTQVSPQLQGFFNTVQMNAQPTLLTITPGTENGTFFLRAKGDSTGPVWDLNGSTSNPNTPIVIYTENPPSHMPGGSQNQQWAFLAYGGSPVPQ